MSCDFLPSDEVLQARDKCWNNLLEKYSIVEESDTELIDDDYISKAAEEDTIKEKDFDVLDDSTSAFSCDEDENDDFDLEKIASRLKPLVEERTAAWPKKGLKLFLKKVDPSVTVEDWIQANSECTTTTTTTKVETTVIYKHNETKTITKSTNRTTTTNQTIQIRIAPQAQAVGNNYRQQLRKIKKSVKDASSAQIKSSQSSDKNRSKAKVLKPKKPKNPIENSVEQQSSVMLPPGKSVATSNKIGKKLQSTSKVMQHRNEALSTDKNERDDTVPVQELSKKSPRSRGHRKVNAILSEKVIQNLIETTRQRNRKRKPQNIEQTENEGSDSITQLRSSTVINNCAKMKQRLSSVVLPANAESPSACDSEGEDVLQTAFQSIASSLETLPRPAILFRSSMSSYDSGSEEDDILSTNYAKLIQNGEIF